MIHKYTWLRLIKTHLAMLLNAGSLVGTTIVTSLLGFAYWWIAARLCSSDAVGLASALISAMTLLGTISMLGLGTLLTGELPRQPGKEWTLIDAALIITGVAGTVAGMAFALIAPLFSPSFGALSANVINLILFALGVGLTALTMVLDQAFIGFLRGDLQFWRNALFAAVKLVMLGGTGFLFSSGTGMIIYGTWLAGNLFSLVVLFWGRKPQAIMQEVPGKENSARLLPGFAKSITSLCPECGALSPQHARFCSTCGYPLSPTIEMARVRPRLLFEYGTIGTLESKRSGPLSGMLCSECGHDLPVRARFCSICGYPLTPTSKVTSLKSTQLSPKNSQAPAQAMPVQEGNSRLSPWEVLRQLKGAALQHHLLNLVLLVPPLVLPLLVTVQLSATENAWFYVSFMLANLVFSLTYALSTVLYAISSAQPSLLARNIRLTLGLAFITSLGANVILQPGAGVLLGVFGHVYAAQAAWCLRLLSLAVFPLIIISHYVALCRIQQRMTSVMLPVTIGALIELVGAAIGARLGGLTGVSLGWLTGLILEALYMAPAVSQAAFPMHIHLKVRWKPSAQPDGLTHRKTPDHFHVKRESGQRDAPAK